jgi:hypothetical protein
MKKGAEAPFCFLFTSAAKAPHKRRMGLENQASLGFT